MTTYHPSSNHKHKEDEEDAPSICFFKKGPLWFNPLSTKYSKNHHEGVSEVVKIISRPISILRYIRSIVDWIKTTGKKLHANYSKDINNNR